MAGRNFDLSIIINAIDKTSSTFSDVNKNLKLTDGQLLAISATSTVAFGAMVYGLNQATKAAAEQQTAELNLAQAMIKTGQYTDENYKSNLALASSLQEVTKFGDEAIIASQAILSTFIKEADTVKQLTPLVLDLATAKGMDLSSAAFLVSKSIGSSTNALARYGIEIEGAAGSSQRAQSAITALSNLFAGKAQADAIGYAGQIIILKNRMGEVQESIGMLLIPKLTSLGASITDNVKKFQNWIETHKELSTAIGGITLSFVGIIALVSSLALIIPKVVLAFELLGTVIKSHPILALASILIPLILNWNKMRDAIDETTTAGRVVGKVMDGLKATFMTIIEIIKIAGKEFAALWLGMTGHFKEAAAKFKEVDEAIANLPNTFKKAYNDIDSTTKNSNKKTKDYASENAEFIKKMQDDIAKNYKENNKIMTEDEVKMQQARLKSAYSMGEISTAEYAAQLENRLIALKDSHSQSLEAEQEYLSLKQELQALDNEMYNEMVATRLENDVLIAEEKTAYDSQKYADALVAQQLFLDQQLLKLRANKDASLAKQTEYYALLAQKREVDQKLELENQNTIKGGFMQMLNEMNTYQTNWYGVATNLQNGFVNAFTAGFMTMIANIGKGWENFAEGFKQIGNLMLQAIIQVFATMAAEWVVKTGLMKLATLAWQAFTIAASWAVAAAHQAAMVVAVIATKAWAIASWLAAQAVAAAKVIAGWATIPFVGAALGIAAAAALIAGMNSQFKLFATGTRGYEGGMALVGENGAELVNLPGGSDVLNNAETRNFLHNQRGGVSSSGVNINIDFTGSTFMGTVDEITEALSNQIYKNLKLNAVLD